VHSHLTRIKIVNLNSVFEKVEHKSLVFKSLAATADFFEFGRMSKSNFQSYCSYRVLFCTSSLNVKKQVKSYSS